MTEDVRGDPRDRDGLVASWPDCELLHSAGGCSWVNRRSFDLDLDTLRHWILILFSLLDDDERTEFDLRRHEMSLRQLPVHLPCTSLILVAGADFLLLLGNFGGRICRAMVWGEFEMLAQRVRMVEATLSALPKNGSRIQQGGIRGPSHDPSLCRRL